MIVPFTLFYLDPPYWGHEDDYNASFSRDDFALMADLLKSLKGAFILSLNDTPQVRQCFAGLPMQTASLTYTAGGMASHKQAKELIITSKGIK